ncbi:hypothetical protein V1264_003301 [Littorina saxatilis]|uniref:Uncharacterized protein n=1 Tax=Littorina saxatilis TaxID=31220 RepID=A0AAN9B4N3_9CAEN
MFRPLHLCTVVAIFLAFAAHYIFLTVASNNTCPYEGNCTYRRQKRAIRFGSNNRRVRTYKICKTLQEQCSAAQIECCPKCCTKQEVNTQFYIVLGVFGVLLVIAVAVCVFCYVKSQKRQAELRQGGVPGGNRMLPTPPPPQAHGYGPVSFIPGSAPGGFGPPPGPGAPGGFDPPPGYTPGGYGPPSGPALGGFDPPPGSAPGGSGPPPGPAPGGFGPPPGSAPGGYDPPPGSSPGGYGPPPPPPYEYSGQAPGGYPPSQEKTDGTPM